MQGLPATVRLPAPLRTVILSGIVPTSRAVSREVLTRHDQTTAHRQLTKQRHIGQSGDVIPGRTGTNAPRGAE